MALGEIQNKPVVRQTPVKQRLISETTGLVKFNINTPSTNDLNTPTKNENERVANLEKRFLRDDLLSASSPIPDRTRAISPKRGINILPSSIIKPTTAVGEASTNPNYNARNNINRSRGNSQTSVDSTQMHSGDAFSSNQDVYLQLAAKQREVLELKFQMQNLRVKLRQAEGELSEIEKICNERSSQIPMNSNNTSTNQSSNNSNTGIVRSNTRSLNSRQSISSLLSSVSLNPSSSQSTLTPNENQNENPFNFQNLKKRISVAQFPTNITLNKIQQDTESFIGKGISFMNTIRDEVFREIESDPDSSTGDIDTERGTPIGENPQPGLNKMKSLSFQNTEGGRVKYSREIDYESDEGEDLDESENSFLSEYGAADVSDYSLAVK